MIKFALAGNPNCGKTTLFNSLTGSTAHVGNWPGVTVDKREGTYKSLEEPINIIDLPGIYSLSPYTPEEVISRNFILDEKPNCVINIVDATNLERNLYLTTQLLEMDVPIIVALNMMDEVKKRGDTIDVDKLSKELGAKVVPISALREDGLDVLMKEAYAISKEPRKGQTVLAKGAIGHLIDDVCIAFKGQKIENPLFHAIKLIEKDEIEVKMHPDLINIVEEFEAKFHDETFGSDLEALIADNRYKYISKHFSIAMKHKEAKGTVDTRSDKIDRILTNRWAGIPIFIVILFFIFHLTFAEDLFFLNTFGAFGEDGLVSFVDTAFEGLLANGGINSPGVILQNLVGLGTDSLTDLIRTGLENLNAESWVTGLICDGALAGIFSVLSFLPQILMLFLFFSILEDSGYMARVAFILDRIFRKFGLSGRAFMPMIMGFGCSVPAMINTRTLSDENEKTATIRVIPFFSCGAKLPILTAMAGGIAQVFGLPFADIITLGMYLLGAVVAIVSIILMRQTTMRGEVPPFIMELPTYHTPQFKSLMLHLWDKVKHFIHKAFTIIFASTILIWFLQNFGWNWAYLGDQANGIENSILAGLGSFIQPIFTPLGFGAQLTKYGWIFVVAAITGLIAKESVIATFAVIAIAIGSLSGITDPGEIGEIEAAVSMIEATGITAPACISFIAFNMLTIPCFAAVGTAKGELTKKQFRGSLIFWIVTSLLVASAIYVIGTFWWTCFIYLAIAAGVIVGLYIHNNNIKNKEAGVS